MLKIAPKKANINKKASKHLPNVPKNKKSGRVWLFMFGDWRDKIKIESNSVQIDK